MLDQSIGGRAAAARRHRRRLFSRVVLTIGTELPAGVVGSPYAGALTMSGGEGPYTRAIISGSVSVTDSGSSPSSATQTFTLAVSGDRSGAAGAS